MPPVTHAQMGSDCPGKINAIGESDRVTFVCSECGDWFGDLDPRLFLALNQAANARPRLSRQAR
jgi:hypothetical protein